MFGEIFERLFKIKGNLRKRIRENRKDLWEFEKYSMKIYNIINEKFEIPCGKKSLNVKIPSFILNGKDSLKKHFFLGLLITDGSIKKQGSMLFHSASKELIYDLRNLIKDVWGFERKIKFYIQRKRFKSYQLTLNKQESSIILPQLPWSHNLVLRQP